MSEDPVKALADEAERMRMFVLGSDTSVRVARSLSAQMTEALAAGVPAGCLLTGLLSATNHLIVACGDKPELRNKLADLLRAGPAGVKAMLTPEDQARYELMREARL